MSYYLTPFIMVILYLILLKNNDKETKKTKIGEAGYEK